MHACEGYIENGRFYPIGYSLSGICRQRAILTILDEQVTLPLSPTYSQLMSEAGCDEEFLSRTFTCQEDFELVDSEVLGQW